MDFWGGFLLHLDLEIFIGERVDEVKWAFYTITFCKFFWNSILMPVSICTQKWIFVWIKVKSILGGFVVTLGLGVLLLPWFTHGGFVLVFLWTFRATCWMDLFCVDCTERLHRCSCFHHPLYSSTFLHCRSIMKALVLEELAPVRPPIPEGVLLLRMLWGQIHS